MELYFIRHGIAVDYSDSTVENDEERWLTDEGIKKMEKSALGFIKLVDTLDIIYSSPLVRAIQTAEIVQKAFSKKPDIIKVKKLEPGADFNAITDLLKDAKPEAKVAFVGHEPDFSSCISECIAGGLAGIEMRKGAICRVDFYGKPKIGDGKLVWLLPSKILRLMA